jgi:hypothetical protein
MDEIIEAKREIEDLLAPYGYYFIGEKQGPVKLKMAFADIGIVALTLLAWGAVQYLKSLFSELGKLYAQALVNPGENAKPNEEIGRRLDALSEQVEKLAETRQFTGSADAASFQTMIYTAIADARTCRAALPASDPVVLDNQDMQAYIRSLGASAATSSVIMAEVAPTLAHRLNTMTRPEAGR